MSVRKYLKDDLKFVIFSEIYNKHVAPKSKREALNILNTAIEVFADKGFHGTTKSMVAKRYGASTAKITYYFGSLDELKLSAIKYTRYLFQSYVIGEITQKKTPIEMFNCYFDCCMTWPRYFAGHTRLWISFLHQCTHTKEFEKINTEAVEVGRQRLEEMIRLGKAQGDFKCEDEAQAASIIHTLITGLLLSNASELESEASDLRIKTIKNHCVAILTSP